MTSQGKGTERRGPWHHAAVAALQGASIEEQLQYLDPDIVRSDDLHQSIDGPGLGFASLQQKAQPDSVTVPSQRAHAIAIPDDGAAQRAAARIWSRWDVHARGKTVRR